MWIELQPTEGEGRTAHLKKDPLIKDKGRSRRTRVRFDNLSLYTSRLTNLDTGEDPKAETDAKNRKWVSSRCRIRDTGYN